MCVMLDLRWHALLLCGHVVPEWRLEAAPGGLDPAPGALVDVLVLGRNVSVWRGEHYRDQLGSCAVGQFLVHPDRHHQLYAERHELYGEQGHVTCDVVRVRKHEAGRRDCHVDFHQQRCDYGAERYWYRRCIDRRCCLRVHLDEGDDESSYCSRAS